MTMPQETARTQLLDAIVTHVPFDGWTDRAFNAAIRDTGLDVGLARAACPRGAQDLAAEHHRRGDEAMVERLKTEDMSEMRFRDKVAAAVRFRIEAAGDKELVRRATTLYALPTNAAEGAKLIWNTADAIWEALGDTSDDVNWYTKRATLSGVYSSTVLYWLGDTSENSTATWAFLDRRIDDVMQIEKLKAQVNKSPTLSKLLAGPNWLLGQIKAPNRMARMNLPGSWTSPRR
ncbi:COQ9 family protein [Sulfitobacter sp. D35]|uniref:COQ9 family protein n=1 Tax=Sulfitobacter sp. D35 TaxID=3083252 RepID=UPI00296F4606|nr:COQ9 family protein [Sulfitobacter sp. D35]MDW4498582.1 COQ9 family protein [Sulfitobacter sp. D35]